MLQSLQGEGSILAVKFNQAFFEV